MATLLSTLLSRMQRYQSVATVGTPYLVRDIDSAIRKLKRNPNLPFFQKKGSLKVFADVLEYAPASDHDYLIFIDTSKNVPTAERVNARYTSIQQFYEDPDRRSQIAEIWNNGALTLGVNIKNQGFISQVLDTAESITPYSVSGDASGLVLNSVNFKEGNSSVQFSVTLSGGTATVSNTFTGFTDSNYLRKYYFKWVYLASAPDSITLRFGVDSSNYISKSVTTQFSGQAFTAGQWNLLAFDLSAGTTTGTISTSSTFAYEAVVMTNAPTGTYYVDNSYLKQWELMDYWYYSKWSVQSSAASAGDKEMFTASDDTYDTTDSLVGPDEWADVVMYDAMVHALIDKENDPVLQNIKEERNVAWEQFDKIWPSVKPQQTTNSYNFGTDYSEPYGY